MTHTIIIRHALPRRLRIAFTTLLMQPFKMREMVMEHPGIQSFQYTSVSNSVLICFDNTQIDSQEVLIRLAVAYSAENKIVPIKIVQEDKQGPITFKAVFAGLSIVAATIGSLLPTAATYLPYLNWTAAASTGLAVVEHARIDYDKKGSVDPEVMSVIYLANQVINSQKFVFPSFMTWLATFGRHLSKRETEGIVLKIHKTKQKHHKVYFQVFISKFNAKASIIELFNSLASSMVSMQSGSRNSIYEKSKTLKQNHSGDLEGIGEKVSGIILTFKN